MQHNVKTRAGGLDRRQFLRRSTALGAATLLPGILAACGSGDNSTGGKASTKAGAGTARTAMTIGALGYAASWQLDPHIGADISTFTCAWHVFEGLMEVDPVTREISPVLATDAPEKLSATRYRSTIREGATFHDGTPVTAADVVASFRRVKDPKTASSYAQYLALIKRVRAVDERTVEFVLAFPTNLLPARLAIVRIVPRSAIARPKTLSLHPVGSGPYAFADSKSSDALTFQRFAKYNGPRKTSTEAIRVRFMTDSSARLAALRSSELQAIENPEYRDLRSLASTDGITARAVPGFNQTILMFNCGKPPFDDKRVRQAIMYGIDREALLRDVYLGNGRIAESYLTAETPGFAKPGRSYTYDPEKAKQLLAEAGHPNGLSFELLVNNASWIGPQGNFIKQQLQKAGINASLRLGDSTALFDRVSRADYSAFITPTDPSVIGLDTDVLMRWLFYGTFPKEKLYWQTPETKQVATLLDQAMREEDPVKQHELWAKAQDVLWEEAPCPTLHHRSQPTGWQSDMTGFQPLNTAGLYFLPKA